MMTSTVVRIDVPVVDHKGLLRANIIVYHARTLCKWFKNMQIDHRELEKKMGQVLEVVVALAIEDNKHAPQATPVTGIEGGDGFLPGHDALYGG
jgi:hypothetical protein